jgi:hypothetical protein
VKGLRAVGGGVPGPAVERYERAEGPLIALQQVVQADPPGMLHYVGSYKYLPTKHNGVVMRERMVQSYHEGPL